MAGAVNRLQNRFMPALAGPYSYAKLADFFPSSDLADTRRGTARLSLPAWLVKYQDSKPASGHPSMY